jgi:hypothetical protein
MPRLARRLIRALILAADVEQTANRNHRITLIGHAAVMP